MKRDIFRLLEQNRGINLNLQQQAAALHNKGPGAVLAVPGSGKTTMLMTRTANLIINHGIKPENILTITFNRAAVLDMQSRFHSIFGNDLPPMNFSTIHAFALSVLKSHCRKWGKQIRIIEGERSEKSKSRILRAIYREVNGEFPGEDKLEELSRWIGYIKNMMLEGAPEKGAPERDKLDIKVDGFKDIFEKYEAFKKEKGFIDFDDMLTEAYVILEEDSRLLSQCRKKYPYIQVDEFQDNSKIQNELIKLVAAPSNNLFVVADDDQCIYGFRGACPQAVLDFRMEYQNARIFFMEQNYRSLKDIVEYSNLFIKGNLQRYNKNMYTENTDKGIVECIRSEDEEEQLDILINALKQGDALPSETAILFRNNLSAVIIADRLMWEGIPFNIKDRSLHFFKHWVTEDILSFLKLALDPMDMESFKRIYYKCGCYISREAADQAEAIQGKSTVYDALRGTSALSSFNRMKIDELEASVRSLKYKNPEFALEYIENDIGYGDYIIENGPKRGYSAENLKSILESLRTIARHTTTLSGFMARLDTLQHGIQQASLNRNYDGVTLSTLHSSKGLEFESVYMIDLAKGVFPPQSTSDQQEKGTLPSAMEEERRLFYVGMTRAKNRLVLLCPRKRNGEFSESSVFVKELCSIMNAGKACEEENANGEEKQ